MPSTAIIIKTKTTTMPQSNNDNDAKLPYYVIAKFNRLTRANPDDDTVWVNAKGERFVLGKLGFSSAIQHSYIYLYNNLKRELDKLNIEHSELKSRHDNLIKNYSPQDALGKGSRKKIKSILNSPNYQTIEERFEAIKRYLKMPEDFNEV